MLSYLAMDLNKAVYPGAGSQQDSYLRLFVWTLVLGRKRVIFLVGYFVTTLGGSLAGH